MASTTITLPQAPKQGGSAPPDPKPISAALQRHFDEVLSQIPTGRSAQVGVAVTTQGVEASVAARKAVAFGQLSGTAYAGREWGGGWLAGGKVGWAF